MTKKTDAEEAPWPQRYTPVAFTVPLLSASRMAEIAAPIPQALYEELVEEFLCSHRELIVRLANVRGA